MIAALALVAVMVFTVGFAIVAFMQEREDRQREAQMISQLGEQDRVYRARYASVAAYAPDKQRVVLMDEKQQRNIRPSAMRVRASGSKHKRAA